ncbi:hypothetical protein WBP06_22850 [Novosphingobium sp. BL-8H]|uniref:hypothetical protein n=1 Tax=Novosphingobium sp. BL-8H TaxID=3127640 RepID=UPI003756ADAF
MLLLVALLLWQGEAVRVHAVGHLHAETARRLARDTAVHLSHSQRDRNQDEAACPFCQEDTAFGHYITPHTPELIAVWQHRIAIAPAPPMAPFRAAPTTRFRIRGPPLPSA